jgi:hypothetical protein
MWLFYFCRSDGKIGFAEKVRSCHFSSCDTVNSERHGLLITFRGFAKAGIFSTYFLDIPELQI